MVRVLTYVSRRSVRNCWCGLSIFPSRIESSNPESTLPDQLRLTNEERSTLAKIGHRLGRKSLEKVATVAKPETILGWFRRLLAQKFDSSKFRSYPERPSLLRTHESGRSPGPREHRLRIRSPLWCTNERRPQNLRSNTQ
jgi:hypothetical protein